MIDYELVADSCIGSILMVCINNIPSDKEIDIEEQAVKLTRMQWYGILKA